MIELKTSKTRSEEDRSRLRETVGKIIDSVIKNGDKALKEYNSRFDRCKREFIRISSDEIKEAYDKVPAGEVEDIKKAADNIRAFAEAQKGTV